MDCRTDEIQLPTTLLNEKSGDLKVSQISTLYMTRSYPFRSCETQERLSRLARPQPALVRTTQSLTFANRYLFNRQGFIQFTPNQ